MAGVVVMMVMMMMVMMIMILIVMIVTMMVVVMMMMMMTMTVMMMIVMTMIGMTAMMIVMTMTMMMIVQYAQYFESLNKQKIYRNNEQLLLMLLMFLPLFQNDALDFAAGVGYPCLLRPSYVLRCVSIDVRFT
jgi:hypothetical protein